MTAPTPDRDALGRSVRYEWIRWARQQPDPKPGWLLPWDELPEPDREVDRRIGERLYRQGLAAGRFADPPEMTPAVRNHLARRVALRLLDERWPGWWPSTRPGREIETPAPMHASSTALTDQQRAVAHVLDLVDAELSGMLRDVLDRVDPVPPGTTEQARTVLQVQSRRLDT